MKSGLLKDVARGIATFTLTFAVGFSAVAVVGYKKLDEDLLDNTKYMDKVKEELGVNMKIMEMYGDKTYKNNLGIVRLRPNSNKKIHVNISDDISERAKGNIRQVLGDMNETFSHINDKYNFQECSEEDFEKYRQKDKTTIKFEYTKFDDDSIQGEAENTSGFKFDMFFKERGWYFSNSTIYFDQERFDQLTDASQLFTIKHELLHTLGFYDTYEEYKDETSMMNVTFAGLTTVLSPNDLKMLYVAYGDKHINKLGFYDQEKMDKIKKMIDDYEVKYYDYLISGMKNEIDWPFQSMSKDEYTNTVMKRDGATITVNNGEFTYTEDGKTQTGKIIEGGDYVILPNIILTSPYDKTTPYNDFLVLLKKDGKIKCYNFDIYHGENTEYVDDLIEGLEIHLT